MSNHVRRDVIWKFDKNPTPLAKCVDLDKFEN